VKTYGEVFVTLASVGFVILMVPLMVCGILRACGVDTQTGMIIGFLVTGALYLCRRSP